MSAGLRNVGFALTLLAWAAFLLPWERCESACHDRVLPQGAHECHAGDDHCHDAEDCCGAEEHESDHDARHTAVSFLTLRPDGAPHMPAALPASAAPAPPLGAPEAAPTHSHEPVPVPPAVATTVLLL